VSEGASAAGRIPALDFLRGIAVMGILVANLPAFALPEAAYFAPHAWGGTSTADIAAWFATYVLVEGKMRGLFSFLFGASMLLVIDRAGEDAASVHLSRMAALLAIGLGHMYLVWGSDILAHYALIGAFAFVFARLPTPALLVGGLTLVVLQLLGGMAETQLLWSSAGQRTPEAILVWEANSAGFGVPPQSDLLEEIAAFRGGWAENVAWRYDRLLGPIGAVFVNGVETLGAVLLGMAGYRSGFLTGDWSRPRYRRWAVVCLGIALPGYAALGMATYAHQFDQRWVFLGSIGVSPPLRTLGFVGYAALVVLLLRPGGTATERIAAVGRAAFTNYLGTSLLMTFIFYGWGLGQFGAWSRAQLYLLVPLAWLIMLAWSKPWLDGFRYGPLEWLWRSLSRLEFQPMRR
jgi:uncharacterized protein